MSLLRATRSQVLLVLASFSLAPPAGPDAAARQATRGAEGVIQSADGALALTDDAPPAPRAMGTFARFGLWDSAPIAFETPFEALTIHYQAQVPASTEQVVAVRASGDGKHWSEWKLPMVDGATARFDRTRRWAQYRMVLLGSATRSPRVSGVRLVPQTLLQAKSDTDTTVTAPAALAPTYRLRVTRQGMVGSRTANGHRITRRDFFVSLPSWSVLSSRNGAEYKVRLSANGRSVVAPVMDVGPWNAQDNYWDDNRTRFKDLPTGWPEDHAAYFERYNRRRAEKGWVRFPSAVDVGDGTYWALGLAGEQATVDVTFLWLGTDPGPNPTPRNSHPSQRPVSVAP